MKKYKVAIIDDDSDFTETLNIRLEKKYDVVTALDGLAGLEIIRKNKPDAVILDLMIPGMDGTKICKEMKGDGRLCDIPVIFLSAIGDKFTFTAFLKENGITSSNDAYMSKANIDTKNLINIIDNLILKTDKGVEDGSSQKPAAAKDKQDPGKADDLSVLMNEEREVGKKSNFVVQANMADEGIYEKAAKDPETFWAEAAGDLSWFKKWDKVLDWNPPDAKWFTGGTLNASYNCVDRHIHSGRRNKAAIIWEGEPGDKRVLTYWDLYREVNKFANVMNGLGIKKGDRVALYMPMIPELPIAVLACARIGAVHTVIFGGFSAEALRDRINDSKAVALITADGGYRRGNLIPLKHDADYAVRDTPSIKHVVVVQRGNFPVRMKEGRDHFWHILMADAASFYKPEPMESEDPLFILYTSGTTGKPKGIVHSTAGYLTGVSLTSKWIFDIKDDDVYWCTADIGWVTGHSYVIYGPLCCGASVLMYEGAPDWPEKDRFWEIIEKYAVTVFYTAPTAVRAFMKWGTDHLEKHNLSSLRLLGSVGEPINPEAWIWYYKNIGKGKCPIVDTWWQTETGSILISPLPGITRLKPGSATKAFPGIDADVVDNDGKTVKVGGGYLIIRKPWPSMLRGIYGDPERFVQQYWSKFGKDIYFTGDGARRDEDGYLWLLGRVDDVMSVAGHRISTTEVESALVDHPMVAEAAVCGIHHEIKGQAIVAFVILKEGNTYSVDKEHELKEHVVKKIGSIARPEKIIFSRELSKTRSGKIMRRLLRDIAENKTMGDTTTLADDGIVEELKKKYEGKEE